MKRLLLCSALLSFAVALCAQTAPKPGMHSGPPQSPDAKEAATLAGKAVTVDYCSPRVRGREGKIFTADGLISHDPTYPVWRAGANKATQLHTEADLQIGGQEGFLLPKGDYTLWVDVSNADGWVLIVNKQIGQWGTKYDKTQDVGRVKMHVRKPAAPIEELKYTIEAQDKGNGSLSLAWENYSASVSLEAR